MFSVILNSVCIRIFYCENQSAVVDLRKQACKLENEIDLKLVSFSKLGTNYSSSIRDYGSQIRLVTMQLLIYFSGGHYIGNFLT